MAGQKLSAVQKVVSVKYVQNNVELRVKSDPRNVELKVAGWNPLQLKRSEVPDVIAVLEAYLEEVKE